MRKLYFFIAVGAISFGAKAQVKVNSVGIDENGCPQFNN